MWKYANKLQETNETSISVFICAILTLNYGSYVILNENLPSIKLIIENIPLVSGG